MIKPKKPSHVTIPARCPSVHRNIFTLFTWYDMFKLVGVCGIFPKVAVPVVQRAHCAAGLRSIPAYIGSTFTSRQQGCPVALIPLG